MTFKERIRVLWDNAAHSQSPNKSPESPGPSGHVPPEAEPSCCGFGGRKALKLAFPLEAELMVTDTGVTLKYDFGLVTTISSALIFGAARVARPSPPLKTTKSGDVLASEASRLHRDSNAAGQSSYWALTAVELTNGSFSKRPGIRRILFESLTQAKGGVESAIQAVQATAGLKRSTKPVLLLVNPFGGTKRGVKNYEQYVRPMLHLSETPFELRKTTHQQHATQIAQEIDIDAYSAIVTISGDGVFHEVVHGLLSRRDWEQASKLPIGLIGSGTANALGKNLMCGSIELATLAVIKLRTRPMDAFSITQNDTVTYSHLQLMWTLLADVDFESEAYRWLGAERMTVAAVIRLIRMRTYHGKLYLLPSDKAHGAGPSRSSSPTPKGNSPSSPATYGPQRIYTADPKAHLSWPTIIDSSFNYFVATNLPWISDDFIVTPHARIADGDIHVVWSEKMSFRDALRPLLDQGTGAYIAQPSVKAERVKALVLEPQGWTWDKERKAGSKMHEGEFMDVSGERVPYVTTKMEIHPGVLNVLCPDWLDESAWTRAYEKATRGS